MHVGRAAVGADRLTSASRNSVSARSTTWYLHECQDMRRDVLYRVNDDGVHGVRRRQVFEGHMISDLDVHFRDGHRVDLPLLPVRRATDAAAAGCRCLLHSHCVEIHTRSKRRWFVFSKSVGPASFCPKGHKYESGCPANWLQPARVYATRMAPTLPPLDEPCLHKIDLKCLDFKSPDPISGQLLSQPQQTDRAHSRSALPTSAYPI